MKICSWWLTGTLKCSWWISGKCYKLRRLVCRGALPPSMHSPQVELQLLMREH